MKKTSSIIILLFCFASYALAGGEQQPRLITVTGNGKVYSPPDRAEINIGVTLRDSSAERVSDEVDKISAKIIAYLKDNGVAAKDIQTSFVSVQPNYIYQPYPPSHGKDTIEFFQATKTVTFTLRNLSKYDKIIQGLFNRGANTINNVQFLAPNVEGKEQLARSKAAKNAKEIAENLAKSLGVRVGDVYSIVDQPIPSYFPITYSADAYKSSGAGNQGPSIAGGVVTIEANVQVQFYIENGKY